MTKRQRTKLISVLITILTILVGWIVTRYDLAPPPTSAPLSDSPYVAVISVEDGDTFTVKINDRAEKVRLIGVDTPEVKDPRKPVQCFGQAASQFTTNLIGTNSVRLESDPKNSDRDRYNRLLRYAYLPDGTLINAEIIKQGYGFAYTNYPFGQEAAFRQYQSDAERQQQGLWGSCQTTANSSGTRQTNPAD